VKNRRCGAMIFEGAVCGWVGSAARGTARAGDAAPRDVAGLAFLPARWSL
jgi:hypothetical protein